MRDNRTEILRVRVTEAEAEKVLLAADSAGMSTSAYLRERCLGRTVTSTVDVRTLALLNKLGGMVAQLWKEGRGVEASAIERGLDGIRDAITRAQAQAGGRR